MKKVLALVLAVVMVLSTSVTALAAEPTLSFSYEQEEGSNTVVVTLSAENIADAGICNVQFTIEYDATKLEVISHEEENKKGEMETIYHCTAGDILPAATINAAVPGKIRVVWESLSLIEADGTLVVMEFNVLDSGVVEFGFDETEEFMFYDEYYDEITVLPDEERDEVTVEFVHDHTGGTASCEAKAVCEICGEEYGELAAHTEAIDEAVAPTCTETGLTEGKHCSVCDKVLVEQIVVEALGHTGGTATCEAKAVCEVCDEEYGELGEHKGGVANCGMPAQCEVCESYYGDLDPDNHVGPSIFFDPKEATCTEDGYTGEVQCACGLVLEESVVIPALGHTEGEMVVENEVAATCGTDGSHDEVVYCSVCGEELSRENVVDKATGEHVYATETERVEPTCTEDGYVIKACGCGATEKTVLAALGHTEAIDEAVAPTCTETGLTEGKHCSVCGEVLVEQTVVDALGHTEGEMVVENEVAATCGTDGSHDEVVYCTVCGEELSRENVVDKATGEHVYATETEKVEPTCTEDGYVIKACGCGATEKTVLAALGHTEGEAVVENKVEATCDTEGSYDTVVYCTVCGEELSRETTTVPALGHDFDEGVVTTEPTCTEAGVKTYTCVNCGETKTEVVPALGHTKGEAVVENKVEATCDTEGSYDTVVYCTVCGEEVSRETVTVPAIGHKHKYEILEQPTCTGEGERKITCENCDFEATEAIEALGHLFGEWEIVKNPTHNEFGLKVRECVRGDCDDVANAIESEVIPKLVYDSNKPNPGVTVIVPGNKTDSESNPNTGAGSVIGFAVLTAVCGAAAFISGKKNK